RPGPITKKSRIRLRRSSADASRTTHSGGLWRIPEWAFRSVLEDSRNVLDHSWGIGSDRKDRKDRKDRIGGRKDLFEAKEGRKVQAATDGRNSARPAASVRHARRRARARSARERTRARALPVRLASASYVGMPAVSRGHRNARGPAVRALRLSGNGRV